MPIDALPKVPSKAWRVLRARAASAPSTRFTAATVAAMLELGSPDSAQANVIRPLRALGLIDEDGSLTPLGNKWRNDATYPDACDEIVAKIYPDELPALTDADGRPSASQVKTWLSHHGFGDSNASQMAATYVMIASKEIPDAPTTADVKKGNQAKKPGAVRTTTPVKQVDRQKRSGAPDAMSNEEEPRTPRPRRPTDDPGIHL
ncbi:MAG: hypothetical protein JWN35_641, partial [Frankiales bacterium]|nr:hypothetical protein [Frankiales bacterium]